MHHGAGDSNWVHWCSIIRPEESMAIVEETSPNQIEFTGSCALGSASGIRMTKTQERSLGLVWVLWRTGSGAGAKTQVA